MLNALKSKGMIRTAIRLKTAASTYITTVADAFQNHLRVDTYAQEDQTYLATLLETAQRHVERYTNRVFNDTVYYFYLSDFPKGGIVLPFSPVKSIASIKYYDADNQEQTWDSGNYFFNRSQEPTKIYYDSGVDGPGTYEDRFDAVTVEFTVGYTSPEEAPAGCQSAVYMLLSDMYENRVDQPRERFTTWKMLAYPHRVFHSTTENR